MKNLIIQAIRQNIETDEPLLINKLSQIGLILPISLCCDLGLQ